MGNKKGDAREEMRIAFMWMKTHREENRVRILCPDRREEVAASGGSGFAAGGGAVPRIPVSVVAGRR